VELYLFRHGEAGKSSPGPRDRQRGLTVEGKRDVAASAEGLRALGVRPDWIVSSPLRRCAETADLVAKKLKAKEPVEHWDELAPEGSRTAFFRRLAGLGPESSVVVVGHEPYLSSMAGDLAGGQAVRILLKKSGVVRVRILTLGAAPRGELRWLLSPKVLRRIGGAPPQ
jgi:phosphohistidine phosphatase